MIFDPLNEPEPAAPDLKTLEAEEPERSDYPTEHLPEPLTSMLDEVCRACGLDADIPGPLLLGAISTACGAGLMLEDRDLLTRSNLFFLTTALSGIGKSRAYREILRPLHGIEAERLKCFREEVLPEIEAEKAALDAEEKGILGKIKAGNFDEGDRDSWKRRLVEIRKALAELNQQAIPPGFLVEDITSQSLKIELTRRTFLSIASPDCGDVIENILGRFNEGKADANPLLSSWQGEGQSINRVGAGATSSEETVSAMVLLGTEDLAEDLFKNKRLKAGGFLARVLFTASKSLAQFDDGSSKIVNKTTAEQWRRILAALVDAFLDAEEPQIVPTSPEASQAFLDAKNGRLTAINSRNFSSFNARLVEQAKRIGLCLHAAEHLEKAPQIPLTLRTAEAGLAIAWFHLRQTLEHMNFGEFESDLKKLQKLKIAAAKVKKLTVSEARKHGNFQQGEIESLAARRPDWLRIETGKPGKSGGRPPQQIILNQQ